ncbi:MAG: glycosyltransferase [Chthoniobacterales bacterium]
MKIAVLCHAQFPIAPPFAGGLESLTHSLCSRLQDAGHDLTLFAHRGSDPRFSVVPVDVATSEPSWAPAADAIARETSDTPFEIAEQLCYGTALADLRSGGYDLIHNHSLHPLPALMGAASGLPVVTTLHTPPIPYLKMSALALRDSPRHLFTAVSDALGRIWSEYAGPVRTIRNGIDVSKWAFSTDDQPGDAAFWFGRICAEKAPHDAAQAAHLGGFPLEIAGPIYDETYFHAELEPLLHGPVRYLGHLDQTELNTHLRHSRATLFTSHWAEPYGLAIAESLASGTPVIASDVGAAPELLADGAGIIVPAGNPAAFAAAFPEAAHIGRQTCRDRAVEFCGIDAMVAGYEALYAEMMMNQSPFQNLSPAPAHAHVEARTIAFAA